MALADPRRVARPAASVLRRSGIVALAVVFLAGLAAGPGAAAQEPGEQGGVPTSAATTTPLITLPTFEPTLDGSAPDTTEAIAVDDVHGGISPALAGVEVTSDAVNRLEGDIGTAGDDLDAAIDAEANAAGEQADLAATRADLERRRADMVAAEAEATRRNADEVAARTRAASAAERTRALIEELVTASYMAAGQPENPLDNDSLTEDRRRSTYGRNLFELKAAERRGHLAERDRHDALAKTAAAQAAAARATIAETDELLAANAAAAEEAVRRQASSQQLQVELRAQLVELRKELALARRTAAVDGVDFTLIVLDSFYRAEQQMAIERPGCGLDWALLAGISRIESLHGTFGTSEVDERADVRPRIIGVPLNGVGFALITDTDRGAFDGDAVYDRAVGPMQFIPSSWKLFGRDGNGDGLRDPNNYYDAALAAAEHLCRGGADVSATAGRNQAVYGYNQDQSYVAAVIGYAARYAQFEIPWVDLSEPATPGDEGG
jgi:membrane-bound lytic murein transglycosylase B